VRRKLLLLIATDKNRHENYFSYRCRSRLGRKLLLLTAADNAREENYFFFPALFSPDNFFISFSRSSFLRILPEMVFGRDSTYSMARGYL